MNLESHDLKSETLATWSPGLFWARGYKTFSCSTQLSMKFVLLINIKLLTIANSFLRNIAEHENFSANKYENASFVGIFIFISREIFMLS